MNEMENGYPHEPQGLYDDEVWVPLSVLRGVMEDESGREMLGALPSVEAFAERVMATIKDMAARGGDQDGQ